MTALEQRMTDIETKLAPPEAPASKRPLVRRFRNSEHVFAQQEPPPLKELTEEELAFCKKHNISPDSRKTALHLQSRSLTAEDKRLIQSIRSKRALDVTYYQ